MAERRYLLRGGRRPGPKPVFSRDDVIDAALAIGIDRFTIREVAARAGVTAAAIYRLFASRDELVDGCLDRVARTMRWPDPSLDWPGQLRAWAEECWRICEEYVGLDLCLLRVPGAHLHVQAGMRSLVDGLCAAGLIREEAVLALDFVGDTVLQTHLSVSAYRDVDEGGRRGLDEARRRFAGVAEGGAVLAPEESWLERGWLMRKIEVIIAGLSQRARPDGAPA